MENSELSTLIEARNILIRSYERLDKNGNPGTSVMLQRDVAKMIERTMSKIDKVLANHVEIRKK